MERMERSVIWISVLVCSTVGGFLPEAWGASAFGLASLACGTLGGIVGVWVGIRVAASLD
jgi:uncharacterized membrane protein